MPDLHADYCFFTRFSIELKIKSARRVLASFPGPSRGGRESLGPGTHCMRMRRGTPEKCGVIGYYRILSVYRP